MKYQSLEGIIHYLPKSKIKAGEGLQEGTYPFFTSSAIQDKFYNEYVYDDECLIIGTGGHASIHYYSGKFATSTDNFVVKVDGYNMKFVYYYLLLNIQLLESKFKGAGLKHISKAGLESISLPVIDVNKQNEICTIMSNLSDQIEIKTLEINKLDQLVKSQFVEMFENKNFNQIVKVEDICTEMKIGPFGSALHKDEISTTGEIFVLGTDNAVDNEFKIYEKRFISNEKYQELVKYTVHPKDIIISMMGTIGRTAMIPTNFCKAIISSHLCYLTADNGVILPEFLQQTFMLNDSVDYQINKHKKGAIMNGLNLKIIKSLEFDLPPIELQRQFIELVKQIDKQKIINEMRCIA